MHLSDTILIQTYITSVESQQDELFLKNTSNAMIDNCFMPVCYKAKAIVFAKKESCVLLVFILLNIAYLLELFLFLLF
mgnify:CR=1 FL=1|jgi:hypothetical protein